MIRPPRINLARRPFRNNVPYHAVFGACILLLAAATGYNVWRFVQTGAELGQLEQEVADRTERYMTLHGEVEAMKQDIGKLNLTTLNAKSSFATSLLLSHMMSWSALFDRLEEITPPEVKIHRVDPDVSSKRIEVSLAGMAQTSDALFEFLKELSTSPFFSNVYPQRESQQEGKTEIEFSVLMNYHPGSKEESVVTASAEVPAGGGAPAAAESSPSDAPGEASGGPAPADPGEAQALPANGAPLAAVPPQPGQGAAGASAGAPAPGAPAPAGSAVSVSDISQLTDEQFIEMFGYTEFMRARGKAKRPGKAKSKAAPEASPAADPNGGQP
ncbi:MAG TPA: PilN domain-containing protein [Candidatus Polarisedimenticolia bacterium]|nr:PilN domain-containing protein [Candidatus Polarisedimenticolia bacterium]